MRLSSGAPVAFFDSGVGGLAVVSEFLKVLPIENVVCFADIANMPYGNKTSEDILKFSLEVRMRSTIFKSNNNSNCFEFCNL